MERIILREKINIPPCPEGVGEDGNGVNSFIYRGEQMAEIQAKYGRENCCLKIMKNREGFMDKGWWGQATKFKGSLLTEATLIQNIYASHDLAPRIYALMVVVINGENHWAQLTDDLGHFSPSQQLATDLFDGPITELAEKYRIETFNDSREWNAFNGKYVDFQGFHLKEDYEEGLKSRLKGVANVGKWGPWENYHPIPELKITGGRNNKKRIKEMHLNEIEFKDKTVMDIGCSEGFFCRYAIDRGAKRVLGIDLKGVIEPARELSYYLGYNNIDYLGADLNSEVPDVKIADVVFFFSMIQHIGLPEWIFKRTREVLIFEGNGKDRDTEGWNKLNHNFGQVEEIGFTNDLLRRIVLWAKN